jgi:hypothetical protein
MTTEQQATTERVLGAARALFQERKILSVDEVRDYLKSVAQVHLPASEVEECISRLFSGQMENLPAVALQQAFLFKRAARGIWRGQYSILIVEKIYNLPEPTDTSGGGRDIYLMFGVADDEEATSKFLGAASSPDTALQLLKQFSLEIDGWFPLSASQCKTLLARDDLKELVAKFGKSLFSDSGSAKSTFIGAC